MSIFLALSGGAPSLAYAQQQSEAEPDLDDIVLSHCGPSNLDTCAPIQARGEVIVLTGSAIERRDSTAPSPLTIVDRTTIDASGLPSLGDVLQRLPSHSNGANAQVNNGGDGSIRINLRGLGAERTLVLINGRRHVPGGTGANSSVDLTAIPIAVVERVEVLTDGASAIYGSDAIAGVVNIITRRRFDGTKASVYAAASSRGDGSVYNLSLVSGTSSRRGNVVFSAEYHEQQPVYAGHREFSRFDYRQDWETGEEYTVGNASVPEGVIIDFYDPDSDGPEYVGNQEWQDLRADDGACSRGVCFNDPETGWRDFNQAGTSDVGTGDFYNYQPENYMYTPSQRYNLFSTGTYEFHARVNGFYEASYTNRQSAQRLAPEPFFTVSEAIIVSRDNAYNPFGRDFRDVRRRMVELGPRRVFQDVNTFRMITGLEGKLSEKLPVLSGWRWQVAYNYGSTESAERKEGNLIRSRLAAAVGPSYEDATGNIHCGTESNPGDPACVPLNLFGGVGTITEEMSDYVTYTGVAKGSNEQRSLTASLTGKLLSLPSGGDVALALGVAHRDEYGAEIPDPHTASGDTTGNKREPTSGGYQVAEAYGELSVVPVIGKQLADWVELSAAARVFDYSSFGTDYTWKAGGLWRIIEGFSVRGIYSTAFRSPGISDLYSGQAELFSAVSDPCDTSVGALGPSAAAQCAAEGVPHDFTDPRTQLKSPVSGNPDLQPETAKIFTMGTVYEPHYAPGLAVTLDYFHIDPGDFIQQNGASIILGSCYGPGRDQDACDQITRDPNTGLITQIDSTALNGGGIETAGVDFSFRYSTATSSAGLFRFILAGEWLQKYDLRQPDMLEPTGRLIRGKGVFDLGMFPAWKLDFIASWSRKPWDAGLSARYTSSIEECKDNDCSVGDDVSSRDIGAYATVDLHGSYSFESPAGTSRLTVGMRNAFDAEPPRIYNGFTATSDPTMYDFLGRYLYVRLLQDF